MASNPSQKRYPPELRERAVRMVFEAIEEHKGERFGIVSRVARQLGIGVESLRNWVRQAEVDGGGRPGVTSEERRRMAQLEERAAAGLGRPPRDGLVFTDPAGEPLHPTNVSKTFTKLARGLGLPPIRLHDLRHTHATLALQAGVHVKVVSERLGHSSVTTTLDTYSHAIPGLQRDAAARVAALIPGLGERP